MPPHQRLQPHPVILVNGFDATGIGWAGSGDSQTLIKRLNAHGLAVFAFDLGGNTLGSDTGIARIDSALTWIDSNYPDIDTSKIVLLGGSGGSLNALNWAWRNPSRIAGVILGIPAVGLQGIHEGFRVLYGPAVETAYGGSGYVNLTGASGAYLSTPDSVANSITGVIDVRIKLAMADWTPAAQQVLLSKWGGAAQHSWMMTMNPTGRPSMWSSVTGSADVALTANAGPPAAADGATRWLRCTFEPNVGGNRRLRSYYSTAMTNDDAFTAGTWVEIGTAVTGASTGNTFDSTSAVAVGARNAGTLDRLIGRVYAWSIRSGIDGTIVSSSDISGFVNAGVSSFVGTQGATWTVHGAASIVNAPRTAIPAHDPTQNLASLTTLGDRVVLRYGLTDPLALPEYVEALEPTGAVLLPFAGGHGLTTQQWLDMADDAIVFLEQV